MFWNPLRQRAVHWLLLAMVWFALAVPVVDARRGQALWKSARNEALKKAFVPKAATAGEARAQPQGLQRITKLGDVHRAHEELKDSLMHVPVSHGGHKGLATRAHTAQHNEFE